MSDLAERLAKLSPKKLILYAMSLHAKLEASERAATEPIAILGMGCRFPGAVHDAASLWRLLRGGVDAITEIPRDRWDVDAYFDPSPDAAGKMYCRHGGFIDGVSEFDADFFGISPREATAMDPQQRVLLEVAWEAIEDAGLTRAALAAATTGTFVASCGSEYAKYSLGSGDPTRIDAYSLTGTTSSVLAGRLSFFLGVQGPAMVVDTACSSSLVALHLACQSLRSGECEVALAGGVNVILSPETTMCFSRLRALAPDGRCKAFDAAADGYVRSEGCAVLVLKRLSAAQRDGDRVLAVVRGSAVNHDGPSSGLTVPNAAAQQAVLRKALKSAGLQAADVDYVEAHGTGTPLGDPIELRALAAVMGEGRDPARPLLVGSIKTNLGHTEGAAGMAGIMKVVLALQHRELPPHLHLERPTPFVDWAQMPLEIPTSTLPWRSAGRPRRAGISGFGASGTNAHVVLEEAPPASAEVRPGPPEAELLCLSARSPEALDALADRYRSFLSPSGAGAAVPLADICRAAAARRTHHEHRLAVVADSPAAACARLDEVLAHGLPAGAARGARAAGVRRRVVFVFPGQGSQWLGMGRRLLDREPVFREAIERCDAAMRSELDGSLLDELRADEGASRLARIEIVQPVLFAVEVALAALFRAWGIEPDAVVGHSMGEAAAAHVAGALSLEDAARVICRRSRLLRRVSGRGAMALVELSFDEAQAALSGREGDLSVAVSNGPRSTVIGGAPEALDAVLAELSGRGVFCRRVKVDVASHSPQMDPLRDDLLAALADVSPRAAGIPIYSTVQGTVTDGAGFHAAYWAENLRRPVLFARAVERLLGDGFEVFLELSPHPILLPSIEEALATACPGAVALPSLRRGEDERTVLLQTLGALYAGGVEPGFAKVYPGHGELPPLPTYAFQRARYWPRPVARARAGGRAHPLLGERVSSPLDAIQFETVFREDAPAFLAQHRLHGVVVVPGANHVLMAMRAAEIALGPGAAVVSDVSFSHALIVAEGEARRVQVVLEPRHDGATFRIASAPDGEEAPSWTVHATGTVRIEREPPAVPPSLDERLTDIEARCPVSMSGAELFQALEGLGYSFGPEFRWAEELRRTDGEVICRLRFPEGIPGEAAGDTHPGLIDGCIQLLSATQDVASLGTTFMPIGFESFRFWGRGPEPDGAAPAPWPPGPLRAIARSRPSADPAVRTGDVVLCGEDGRLVAELRGLTAQRVGRDVIQRMVSRAASSGVDAWLHELAWERRERTPSPAAAPAGGAPEVWLLLGDRGGRAARLADHLAAAGKHAILAHPADAYEERGPSAFAIDPQRPGDVQRLIERVLEVHGDALGGVVHLLGLDAVDPDGASLDDLRAEQRMTCESLLALVQEMARAGWRRAARLWVVTRGAQAVGDGTAPIFPAQAAAWGLCRVVAHEHPELRCTRVDLDPAADEADVDALIEELTSGDGEDQIAIRDGARFVARLARSAPGAATAPAEGAPIRGDATYLVVGGLGGIGLALVERMVLSGARHLVLVGRRGASEAQAARLARLAEAGAEVVVEAADVADAAAMAAVFARLDERMPPLKGIVHAAGVLADRTLLRLDADVFRAAVTPKLDGAWNLHVLARGRPLDFFVLFSSVVALLGSPGQGNYAAANAFVDALAHHRRRRGEPALSIGWGPWAEIGLAAQEARRGERVASAGVASLSPEQGLAAFERLLGSDRAQIAVVPLDVRQWVQFFPRLSDWPFLARIAREHPGAALDRKDRGAMREALSQAAAAERRGLLEKRVREQVALVLHKSPARVDVQSPLQTQGFDSLMALELRNRLEHGLDLSLSATVVFNYPTVVALSTYLLEKAGFAHEEPPGGAEPAADAAVLAALLEAAGELSEGELAGLFADESTE